MREVQKIVQPLVRIYRCVIVKKIQMHTVSDITKIIVIGCQLLLQLI